MRPTALLGLALPLYLLTAPALAQEPPPPELTDVDIEGLPDDENEILVVANRIRGQVDAPQPPLVTLDEADIASYGASSISELLEALAPQTASGSGRGGGAPVTLINGKRTSSPRETRNIPPEAIRRVEVLPEEVALRFGYPATSRVVNFILQESYSSRTVDGEIEVPGRGGTMSSELGASLFKIAGVNRINLTARVEDTTALLESERDVVQSGTSIPTFPSDPDPAEFRTLIGERRQYSLDGTWTTGFGEGAGSTNLTLNAALTRSESTSLSGLPTVRLTGPSGTALRTIPDSIERVSKTINAQAGFALNRGVGDWQMALTGDGSFNESRSRTDRRTFDTTAIAAAVAAGTLPLDTPLTGLPGPGADTSLTESANASTLLTMIGRPLRLPAGELATTIRAGFTYTGITSRNSLTAGGGMTRLKRGDVSTGINISVPIASAREEFLAPLGELSLNLSAGINRLSDFGTLYDWSVGSSWSPTQRLRVQATYLVNEAAPSLTDLGGPRILTPNVTVFDFVTGDDVLVTVESGGNPNLQREKQRDLKLGLYWQLPELPMLQRSNLVVEYFRNRSENVTAGFPVLTPAIEAAFPGRVTRDLTGRLAFIDRRSVTFFRESGSRLRYGVNLAGAIGSPPQPAAGAGRQAEGRGPDASGGGFPGPGGPGGRAGGTRGPGGPTGPQAGRWNLSVYHTIRFEQEVIIAPGVPVLDLLAGDALSGGGVARHALEIEGGAFHRGFGLRFSGTYAAPTAIRSNALVGTNRDLEFSGLFRLNLRTFINFDQKPELIKATPFLKGTRLSFSIDNVFGAYQRVVDAAGAVPISYQPDLIDPRGRTFGIDLRKVF